MKHLRISNSQTDDFVDCVKIAIAEKSHSEAVQRVERRLSLSLSMPTYARSRTFRKDGIKTGEEVLILKEVLRF